MDGGGRLAEPLKRARQTGRNGLAGPGAWGHMRAGRERRQRLRRLAQFTAQFTTAPMAQLLHCALQPLADFHLPRGAGAAASALLIGGSVVYGTVAGGHVSDINEQIAALRDAAANAAGFNIASIALTGEKQVSREDVLAAAGITGRTSLLFLAADSTRRKLKANPWIADGTVLKPYVARRFTGLPLVVGAGARERAKDVLALIDRHPEISASVAAAVLVAERRWNLRLKNGIDVRLPETDVQTALATLVHLDREKKLLSRDITAIDLRLPDRVTVRLSDEAAQAREDALKPKTKRKG